MQYGMISSLRSTPSVTVFLGMPNNEKDNTKYAIVLKNLIREVTRELKENYAEQDYEPVMKHLEEIERNFIPTSVAESIFFFISKEFNEQVTLPFSVESGFQIGESFSTRKLLRSSSQTTQYYVLTLGFEESRLLKYQNNKMVKEYKDKHFPILNKGFWTSDRLLNSMGSVRTNYQKEFYKLIDSELQSYLNREPHPILLAGVEENCSIYKEIANRNDLIVGQINGNFTSDQGESTHVIGDKAFLEIKKYIENQERTLISDLDEFKGRGRTEQDLNTIYTVAISGRGKQLIVDRDYYLEAVIKNGQVSIDNIDSKMDGYTEDVVNEIIYQVMRYGGEVVFVKKNLLKEYEPIVLKTRF